MDLINGDCLEVMKTLGDNSIDLLFADLPYGCVSCKWDTEIDLELFWKEANRVCRDDTPMFFTCNAKFGNTLINSNKKFFKFEMIWLKSKPTAFLLAHKQPMRKHELIYVFYRKQPDIYGQNIKLHHTHKFLNSKSGMKGQDGLVYGEKVKSVQNKQYEPPLPVTVLKEDVGTFTDNQCVGCYVSKDRKTPLKVRRNLDGKACYDPPLPVTVLKEDPEYCKYDVNKNAYGGGKEGRIKISKDKKEHQTRYNPPLPVTVLKEEEEKYKHKINNTIIKDKHSSNNAYNTERRKTPIKDMGSLDGKACYEPPLPVTVLKEDEENLYGTNYIAKKQFFNLGEDKHLYDPPLPDTLLEIKSQGGKHSTQKPVALMEWVIKYYTKEGDVVLDPTCGSGSTGVACKNLNRLFIGIEKDEEIYETAFNRLIE